MYPSTATPTAKRAYRDVQLLDQLGYRPPLDSGRAHDFALIALPGFMESSPVAANVLLSHDANNDLCEAWLTEELRFDLSSLKEAWQETYDQDSGAIRILLNHGEELPDLEILYEF